MGIWRTIKAVVTLGKSIELEERVSEHESTRQNLIAAVGELNRVQTEMAPHMRELGRAKKSAIRSLRRVREVLGSRNQLTSIECSPVASHPSSNYATIDTVIRDHDAAIAAIGGLGTGALATVGAWGLVGTFGAASTGTVIGTLGGAAATKATLAWFGGGAIAAGGGGMALGGVVLGGIVLLPGVVFGVWKLNSGVRNQLAEVVRQIESMQRDLDRVKFSVGEYQKSIPRIQEVAASIQAAHAKFDEGWQHFHRAVFPIPLLSTLYRWLLELFTGYFLKPNEICLLDELETVATVLAAAVDQKVFTQAGAVSKAPIIRYNCEKS